MLMSNFDVPDELSYLKEPAVIVLLTERLQLGVLNLLHEL